ARVWQGGKLVAKSDVREGGEGMGPVAGDRIAATYGFDKGIVGSFGTHRAHHGVGARFGLHIFGSRGVVPLTTGSLPPVYFVDDRSWSPGKSKAAWQEVSSAGLGKPEPLKDGGLDLANRWILQDLIEAIEKDRQPVGSMYDGRAALEMILAVYESHRLKG